MRKVRLYRVRRRLRQRNCRFGRGDGENDDAKTTVSERRREVDARVRELRCRGNVRHVCHVETLAINLFCEMQLERKIGGGHHRRRHCAYCAVAARRQSQRDSSGSVLTHVVSV